MTGLHGSKQMEKDQEKSIRDVAIRYLARREYSRYQLSEKLISRGYEAAAVESVLSELEQNSYLCEKRFTDMFVRTRIAQGKGPVRITAELRQHGVPNELIAAYIDLQSEFWVDTARRERKKRFGELQLDDLKERARQLRFLQYRGFTLAQANLSFDIDQD